MAGFECNKIDVANIDVYCSIEVTTNGRENVSKNYLTVLALCEKSLVRGSVYCYLMSDTVSKTRTTTILTLLIPLGLAAIHFLLPESLRDVMVFDHSEFSIITLWTSAFVHLDFGHLLSNLVGYIAGIVPTLVLFTYQKRHRVFRRILFVFLVTFPPLIAISNYAIFQFGLQAENAATRGFSGVIAAIFGLLFAAVLEVIWEQASWKETFGIGASVLLLSMIGILIRGGSLTLEMLGLGVFGVLLSLSLVVSLDALRHPIATAREYWLEMLLVPYCVAVLVVFIPLLFPINWIQDGSITNIFGHGIGLLLGFLGGAIIAFLLTDQGQIEIRRRRHLKNLYISKVSGWTLDKKGLFTILGPVALGTAGYLYSPENSILTGATVLYASLLLFREIPEQPVLSFEPTELYIKEGKGDEDDTYIIATELRNVGGTTAEDVVLTGRIYDPISNQDTHWIEGNAINVEKNRISGDPSSENTFCSSEKDPKVNELERIDIRPSHYQSFFISIDQRRLPNEEFTEEGRLELRVDAVNQKFTAFDVHHREIMEEWDRTRDTLKSIADIF